MPYLNSVEFLKQKAKEKGIKPKFPKGMGKLRGIMPNLPEQKLRSLETGQTNMDHKLNEIIQYLAAIDSKVTDLLNRLGKN